MKSPLVAAFLFASASVAAAAQPIASTPVITRNTAGHRVPLSARLKGKTDIYLVITDAGDGYSCDWANWIAPRVSGPKGTLKLTDVNWRSAKSAWGQTRINRNAGGGPLQVNGEYIPIGIGSHANSMIHFQIPEGYTTFEAECGLDNGGTDQKFGATVQFSVYTTAPANIFGADAADRTPDLAVDLLETPADLEATLVAAEPTLLSPSTIDVDHLGRIWVAEVVNYRRFANKDRQDREEGDRILVLQDTDGDGAVDSSHTFYQGRDVDSAHGICVLGNRVIVSALDKVINFYDDNGDLIPDRKEVMFTGIKGAQHDHGIHSFTFGPDGRLYFNFGNAGKELHNPDGSIVTDIAGKEVKANRKPYQEGMAFRCDMDGSNVETLGWNFRNNWELTIDSFGTIWQSDNDDDGNRGVRINYVMEYGNYGYRDELTGAGWKSARTGIEKEIPRRHWHLNDPGVIPNLLLTGAGAPCGIEVYEGTLLPERFLGQLLHCDAGVNVVRSYHVSSDGAGYKAVTHPVLSSTRDRWFRPCDVSIAADGSLIIADWYDPGVGGHRQGDVDRGRLFRVAPMDAKWVHPKFDFQSIDGAINALQSCNRDARYRGWQALTDAGKAAEPALNEVYQHHADPRMRARALWLLARLDGQQEHYISSAARDDDENIRIVAIRLARQHQTALAETIQALSTDDSPAVRRECVLALCNLPPKTRPVLWVPLAQSMPAGDRWFLEALGIAAHGIWDQCLTAFLTAARSDAVTSDVVWRSRAQQTPTLIAQHIRSATESSEASPQELARWFRSLDFQDRELVHAEVLALLTSIDLQAINGDTAAFIAAESLKRLRRSLLEDDPQAMSVVERALDYLGPQQRLSMIDRFQLTRLAPELVDVVAKAPESQQAIGAVRALVNLERKQMLLDAALNGPQPQAEAVLTAIGRSRNAAFSDDLLRIIDDDQSSLDLRRAAIRSGMRIQKTAQEIVRRVKDQQISTTLQQTVAAGLHGSSDEHMRSLGRQMFPLPEGREGEKLPAMSELMKLKGNPKNGRLVFNTSGTCHKCHVINRMGRDLGPNLSEIGSKLSRRALLESVLFPSAGISHNYDTWTVLLANGTVMSGLIASETDDTITLLDNEAVRHAIAIDDIDEKLRQPISLMPADLQKVMTTQELVDVITYLETLKKAAN